MPTPPSLPTNATTSTAPRRASPRSRFVVAGLGIVALCLVAAIASPRERRLSLSSLLPTAPPYLSAEARIIEPPFEPHFRDRLSPAKCATCHREIFEQWNGSMMSNSWRDPAWRGAFLLVARLTSTAGDCDLPDPPDGTAKAELNPFANADCSSTFDTGRGRETLARPGSLLDGFCSQCHMPSNYVDNVLTRIAGGESFAGRVEGHLDPGYNPTSDHGTGIAFATLDAQVRNTVTGKAGIFCAVCHTLADTRETAFANYRKSGPETPAMAAGEARGDRPEVPDPSSPNLGYAIGAGAYQLSPHAIANLEFLGPIAAGRGAHDPYLSGVFGREIERQQGAFAGHKGAYQALHERAEACAACHDVTNALPIKNRLGFWVGGFPIERTYTEWAHSRYADRPGNASFDPRFKRDCQTCHMQQDRGQPGTAQTLYVDGAPVPPRTARLADDGPERTPAFTHHFIGGNTYLPRLIGADVNTYGGNEPYPELSVYSFSSADERSLYHNAYWTGVGDRGAPTHHARLAWERLRNVLELDLEAPAEAGAGSRAPLTIRATNSGSGHNFPSGFPEGRNAWVAVRAFDLASGNELPIHDAHWGRTSLGVGYLTREDGPDPNFPGCEHLRVPAGAPDPYAHQFRAVASLGDGCPTLELPYAKPLNLEVNAAGLPVDAEGRVIDRDHPRGLPVFRDLDGDGDLFDDAYLVDTRLRPLPHPGATVALDRYAVEIPAGTVGPVAVVAAIYYQSLEAVVAKKFLGNLADTDTDFVLEPCVLGGPCDGRTPSAEPAVVEGAPPVPMAIRSRVIALRGSTADRRPPAARVYPRPGAEAAHADTVVKVSFSEPVSGVDERTFTLSDAAGFAIPAAVDQIGDGTWGLFPHRVFLEPGATYTARLAAGICDAARNCTREGRSWRFRVARDAAHAEGDTAVPLGFSIPE